jgi:hypothetical protein
MAATNNNALAHLLMDAVPNFSTAYAAIQESPWSNAANIVAIQGQLQMLCQAVGTGQPPQQQQRHPQKDAAAAKNAAEPMAAATMVVAAAVVARTMVAVAAAAITMAVAATAVVAAAAMQTKGSVATVVAMGGIRTQAAPFQ